MLTPAPLSMFQQQNISIKIDTTTQEYHSGVQKLGSPRSVSVICVIWLPLISYLFFLLYSDARLVNKILERVIYQHQQISRRKGFLGLYFLIIPPAGSTGS